MELIRIPKNSNGYLVDPCAVLPATQNSAATSTAAASAGAYSPGDGPPPPSSYNPPQASPPAVKILNTITFRVSQYNTFLAKMNAWAGVKTETSDYNYNAGSFEKFDKYELESVNGRPPLISAEILTNEAPWFSNEQVMAIYNYSGSLGFTVADISNRNPNILGFPPKRAVSIPSSGLGINSSHWQNGVGGMNTTGQSIKVYAPEIVGKDFLDLKQLAAYDVFTNPTVSQQLQNLLNATYGTPNNATLCSYYNTYGLTSNLTQIVVGDKVKLLCPGTLSGATGKMPVLFRYRLPGTNQLSSEKKIDLN